MVKLIGAWISGVQDGMDGPTSLGWTWDNYTLNEIYDRGRNLGERWWRLWN